MYIVVYNCIVLDLPRGRMVTPCVIEVFTHSSPTVIRDWDDALGAIRSGFTPLQLSRGCLNVPDVFLPHLPISFVAVFTRHCGEDVLPCRHMWRRYIRGRDPRTSPVKSVLTCHA